MISPDYVRQFFPLLNLQRRADVYRPLDQLAAGDADERWVTVTLRKEELTLTALAAFSGTELSGVTQVYSVLETPGGRTPQLYRGCRVYDKEQRAWFLVVADVRTAGDALQTIACSALKPGLTPQLARTGD